MRSKQKSTTVNKRTTTYDKKLSYIDNPDKASNPLRLPPEFQHKISTAEYKKIKDAFFIEASQQFKLARDKFPVVMRSLGIVLNTVEFHKIFNELEEKQMTWRQFIQAYIAKRGAKGSYNELSHAVYQLAKQYRGDWEQCIKDLMVLGDVLSQKEVQILKNDILKGRTITTEALINSLLYQK